MHPLTSHNRIVSSSLSIRFGIALMLIAAVGCGKKSKSSAPYNGPSLSATSPADGAIGVALNTKVAAYFDQAMAPLTTTTFTLKQGTTVVPGSVAASADMKSAIFSPTSDLTASTIYTGTITVGATSVDGLPIQAEETWSFTTGTSTDTGAPTVTSTSPADGAINVPTNTGIHATFSEPMDPTTITAVTFTASNGTASVSGSVTYGPGTTATLLPSSALAVSTLYSVRISVGAKDLAGNPLANPYLWNFTTGTTPSAGPAPVLLGAAGNFVILSKTGISTVPASAVTGDIGVSPAAATYLTGWSLVADASNVFSTSSQLTGRAYAANYMPPTPSILTTSVLDMQGAFTDAASRPNPDFTELATGNLGGLTLVPGLYNWTSTVTIPTNITIAGGANDVWIFQTTGDLKMTGAKSVILSGGAQAKNVFWEVAGKVIIGANAHFEGILLCKTDVTMQTGSTMKGRILSQTHVALQKTTLTGP